MADYVTRLERFQQGDYPMVCVISGRPAGALLPVVAERTSAWPWFLLPVSVIWFTIASWLDRSDSPTGLLPFADGQHARVGRRRGGVRITYDRLIGVVIRGAHPDFIKACREQQWPTP